MDAEDRPPPYPAPKPGGKLPWPVVLLLVLIGVGVVLAVVTEFGKRIKYEPTAPETTALKSRILRAVYANPSVIPPGDDREEAKIARVLTDLSVHQRTGDAGAFAARIHVRRLMAEAWARGDVSGVKDQDPHEFVDIVRNLVVNEITDDQKIPGLRWEEIQLVGVRYKREKTEAEAYCWVRSDDDTWDKWRFWLIFEDDKWQVFDWESLLTAWRRSSNVILYTTNTFSLTDDSVIEDTESTVLWQRANAEREAGRSEKALPILLQAIGKARFPREKAQFQTERGQIFEGLEKWEDALKEYEKALRWKPDYAFAEYQLTQAHSTLENFEEVVKHCKAFMEILGPDPSLYSTMGWALEALNRFEDAKKAYEAGAACTKFDNHNRYNLGLLQAREGRSASAVKLISDSCRAVKNPEIWFSEAVSVLDDDATRDTWHALCRIFHEDYPDSRDAKFALGRSCRLKEDYPRAVTLLNTALNEDGDYFQAKARFELAIAHAHQGNATRARELAEDIVEMEFGAVGHHAAAYVEALEKNEDALLKALRNLFHSFPDTHREIRKSPVFQSFLDRSPFVPLLEWAEDKSKFENDVLQVLSRKDFDEAQELSREFIRKHPGDSDGYRHLGRACRNGNKPAEAEKALRKGLSLAPPEEHFLYRPALAYALADQGKFGEIPELLRQMEDGGDPEMDYVRAYALAARGKNDEAAAALKKAVGIAPRFAWSAERDAVFTELRKRADVREFLRKAREE